MAFTTPAFLLLFLLTFAAYWGTASVRTRCVVIIVASYVFYGWWDVRFVPLMLATSLLDFGCGLWLSRTTAPGARRAALVVSVIGNIGSLAFFKYFNFFVDSAIAALATLGWNAEGPALHIILPVGISFYTFQTLSYTIDVYQGRMAATSDLAQYLAYVSFFPQLVAGPIERATHLLPQFATPAVFSAEAGADGCRLILLGCVKKMLLADNLGSFVVAPYAMPGYYTGGALLGATVCFAFQIYCDFSAYTDIARGLGRLFGIDLRANFSLPYFSQSLDEFWRRWHISLSTWFRDYVYLPLGGSRVSRGRMIANIMVVFVVSGLWHGAAWTFVMWGLVHGLAVAATAAWDWHRGGGVRRGGFDPIEPGRLLPSLPAMARMGATFGVVLVAWVFFRAPSLGEAFHILGRIATWARQPIQEGMIVKFSGNIPVGVMGLFLAIFLAMEWFRRDRAHVLEISNLPRPVRWVVYTVLFWTTAWFGTHLQSDFIYFQF